MAGEGLGLAYQASKPIEHRSYDIIKEQLAYIEAKKGAEEASKRQALLEQNKQTYTFLKDYAITMPEVEGYYAKDMADLTNEVMYLTNQAGQKAGQGDILGAVTDMNKLKSNVGQAKSLIDLFSYSAEQAAQSMTGKDGFILDPVLNKEFVSRWENIRKGGSKMSFDPKGNLLFSQLKEDGTTETMYASEAFSVLSGGLTGEVDVGEWGSAFVNKNEDKIQVGGKYGKETFKCWNCEGIKVPKGMKTIRDRAMDSFDAESSKAEPLVHFRKYVMLESVDGNYNPEMSDEEYKELKQAFVDKTAGSRYSQLYQDETDPLGEKKIIQDMDIARQRLVLDRQKFALAKKISNNKNNQGTMFNPILDESGVPIASIGTINPIQQSGAWWKQVFSGKKGKAVTHSIAFAPVKLASGQVISGAAISPSNEIEYLIETKDGSTGFVEANEYINTVIANGLGVRNVDELKAISFQNILTDDLNPDNTDDLNPDN